MPSEREATIDQRRVSRRTVLRGTAAAAATGLAVTAGSVSGQSSTSIEIIEIDDGGWFGSWSADGDLPVVGELFVFVHGWYGDSTVESQAADVLGSMEDGGYDPDAAAALKWPASTIDFFGAQADTEDVGGVAADLAEDFYDSGGGNIRLVGHSLGGRCVLWTADKLSSGYEIETIAPLGAAADGDTVCPGGWFSSDGIWYDGIAEGAGVVRNYHSLNDDTVGDNYDHALGNRGADCSDPPSNYVDVDVTGSVGDHFEFLGDGVVGENLANNLDSTDVS